MEATCFLCEFFFCGKMFFEAGTNDKRVFVCATRVISFSDFLASANPIKHGLMDRRGSDGETCWRCVADL